MALRVLLADESSTIKKVFQLALQDYAVEVTSVAVGTDVMQVAEKTKPDIIFADVLLQKKSGYEVCREIKNNPLLTNTPVILIWSGFMELDNEKLKSCGANGHLEKPFDAKKLRSVVQQHVTKTKAQVISDFLNLPVMPTFEDVPKPHPMQHSEPENLNQTRNQNIATPDTSTRSQINLTGGKVEVPAEELFLPDRESQTETKQEPHSWTMDNFAPVDQLPDIPAGTMSRITPLQPPETEETEAFTPVHLPTQPARTQPSKNVGLSTETFTQLSTEPDEAEWVNKSINRFKLPVEKTVEPSSQVKYQIPQEKIDPESVIFKKTTPPLPLQHDVTVANSAPTLKTKKFQTEIELEADVEPPPPPASQTAKTHTFTSADSDKSGVLPLATPVEGRGTTHVPQMSQLSSEELEKIIRAQSQEVIEKVVWQIVPDIATRVIEREIERLLKERHERR